MMALRCMLEKGADADVLREMVGFAAQRLMELQVQGRAMSTREITGHLRELYGIKVSADLISAVTDAVLEGVAAWQTRPDDFGPGFGR